MLVNISNKLLCSPNDVLKEVIALKYKAPKKDKSCK